MVVIDDLPTRSEFLMTPSFRIYSHPPGSPECLRGLTNTPPFDYGSFIFGEALSEPFSYCDVAHGVHRPSKAWTSPQSGRTFYCIDLIRPLSYLSLLCFRPRLSALHFPASYFTLDFLPWSVPAPSSPSLSTRSPSARRAR